MKRVLICLMFISLMFTGCASNILIGLKPSDTESTDSILSEETSISEESQLELLEKYDLEISVYAWNDFMPYVVEPDGTFPYPRPHFTVQFTSTQNKSIPNINVWVKIICGEDILDLTLTCDGNSPQYNFETFRAGFEQGLYFGCAILTAVVTFEIGNEKQTLTFYPEVMSTH